MRTPVHSVADDERWISVMAQGEAMVAPDLAVSKDEYPRSGTTVEKLAALKAAFMKEGTVTAGNSSGINDGAAALVVATEKKAQALGRKPLARILSYATSGVEPMRMLANP